MRTPRLPSPVRLAIAALLALAVVPVAGCPEDAKGRLRDPCGADAECASGLCLQGVCLDPFGDDDGDLLLNGREGELGTNPLEADTDGDGENDFDEVGSGDRPRDTDGDGLHDAIESNAPSADADEDCLPDEVDPQNDVFDPESERLVLRWCRIEGVCGADIEKVTAVCAQAGVDDAVDCDYTQVASFEDIEESCDALDNDCDGGTDEELSDVEGGDDICPKLGVCADSTQTPLATCDGGEWLCEFTGIEGFEPGGEVSCDGLDNDCNGETDEDFVYTESGVELRAGDACGLGACAGGEVICAEDGAGVVCSTVAAAVETCDGTDDDCDGLTDEDFALDGVTVGGACSGMGDCAEDRGVVECADAETPICSVDAGGSAWAGGDEVCDGADNDCDGETDEEPVPEGDDPVCPTRGVCEGVAVVYCDDGDQQQCDLTQVPDFEADEASCDGLDNDCDGRVDEAIGKFFVGAPTPLDWGVPADRAAYAAAAAPDRGVLVLVGGVAPWWNPFAGELGIPPAQATFVDTWELDLATGAWVPQVLVGTRPAARTGAWMVHDAANGRMLMGGGAPTLTAVADWRDDVWAYDLETHAWTELVGSGAPAVRQGVGVVAERPGGERELWIVGGDREGGGAPFAWRAALDDPTTFAAVDLAANARAGAAAAYDPAGDRIAIFGGSDDDGDTNAILFVELGGAAPALGATTAGGVVPPAQTGASVAADPTGNGHFVLYGARPGDEAATYLLIPDDVADPQSWSWQSYPVDATNPPPPRRTAAVMAADGERLWVWLGNGPDGLLRRDAWSLDPVGRRWRAEELAATFPPPRRGAASAVDPGAGPGVDGAGPAWYVYGGAAQTVDGFVPRTDLWRHDLQAGTWESLEQMGGARPDVVLPASVVDPAGRRLYLFGGTRIAGDGALDFQAGVDALWVLNLETLEWSSLSLLSGGGPASLIGHSVSRAPDGTGAYVYGGYSGEATVGDLWFYEFDSGVWTALAPGGDAPLPRAAHAAWIDEERGYLFAFGGEGGAGGIGVYEIGADEWTERPLGLPARSAVLLAGYDPWSEEGAFIAFDLDLGAPLLTYARLDVSDVTGPATLGWTGATQTAAALFYAPVVYDPAGRGLLGLAGPDLLDARPHGLWRFPQECP